MTEPAYLPCSEVMEKAALSSAMHHPELLLRHPHDPAAYHLVGHRVIYETMRSLAQEGRPVDMPTLWYAMGEPEWPSYSYLSVLDGEYPDWTAYDYYVGQLIGYHLRRQVVLLGEAAAQRAQVSGIDSNPAELLSWLRERVSGLSGETLGFRHAMACGGTDSAPVTTGFEILDAQLLGGPRAGELVVVMGRPGMGKAQPLDEPVLTPVGWTTMGEIRPGDFVIGGDGKPARVLAVHPQGVKEIFEVTMEDGTSTRCCDDHLWLTTTRADRRTGRHGAAKPLSEVRSSLRVGSDNRLNHAIPWTAPVELSGDIPLPIDPWLLGAWIGDGIKGKPSLANPEPWVLEEAQRRAGSKVKRRSDGMTIHIHKRVGKRNWFTEALGELGLIACGSHERFIPKRYLLAGVEDRLSLLRGLVDTDGFVLEGQSTVDFSTSSEQLAGDVTELVRSLGGRVTVGRAGSHYRLANGEARECRTRHRLSISLRNGLEPFLSPKHRARWMKGSRRMDHFILETRPAGLAECQCLTVEGGLYVTKDYIVTHNTSLMLSSCLRQAARGLKVGIFSLEMSHRELMLRLLSIESGVGFQALRLAADDSFLPGPERQSLLEARERLAEYRIEIDDQAALGLADLENRAYQLKSAKGLDVLWVDNMPLVATKEESDYRAMSKVSWAMKALAKNLKIPVFALHQLSRLVERRDNHRPILSDLADSGKIEANADTVIGLYRPWVYDNRESPEAAELHVLKQRNGPIGTLGMMFLPSSMEYREER